mmetsp:Transcript_55931/g.131109  ORF Transcript_55931/g.131109 Transcript_55931/m.131109 type:complete len:216 (-) Transcript_55931:467-1114(-)
MPVHVCHPLLQSLLSPLRRAHRIWIIISGLPVCDASHFLDCDLGALLQLLFHELGLLLQVVQLLALLPDDLVESDGLPVVEEDAHMPPLLVQPHPVFDDCDGLVLAVDEVHPRAPRNLLEKVLHPLQLSLRRRANHLGSQDGFISLLEQVLDLVAHVVGLAQVLIVEQEVRKAVEIGVLSRDRRAVILVYCLHDVVFEVDHQPIVPREGATQAIE